MAALGAAARGHFRAAFRGCDGRQRMQQPKLEGFNIGCGNSKSLAKRVSAREHGNRTKSNEMEIGANPATMRACGGRCAPAGGGNGGGNRTGTREQKEERRTLLLSHPSPTSLALRSRHGYGRGAVKRLAFRCAGPDGPPNFYVREFRGEGGSKVGQPVARDRTVNPSFHGGPNYPQGVSLIEPIGRVKATDHSEGFKRAARSGATERPFIWCWTSMAFAGRKARRACPRAPPPRRA